MRQIAVPILWQKASVGALMVRTNTKAAPELGDPAAIGAALTAAAEKIAALMPAAARTPPPPETT